MAILAAVGEGKTCWIVKAAGSAMDDFGHHGERLDSTRADPGREQQLRKIRGSTIGGCSQCRMQTA